MFANMLYVRPLFRTSWPSLVGAECAVSSFDLGRLFQAPLPTSSALASYNSASIIQGPNSDLQKALHG